MKPFIPLLALLLLSVSCGSHAQSSTTSTPLSPDGSCPAGRHIVHADGSIGISDPDSFVAAPAQLAQYHCELDQSPATLTCGVHGQATTVGGVAACACETGFAGSQCEVCATGYAPGGLTSGSACMEKPVNRDLVIMGAERLVPYGGSTVLSAQSLAARPGSDPLVSGAWRLDGEPGRVGCLSVVGEAAVCRSSVIATEVVFSPPAQGAEVSLTTIRFAPDNGPALQVDVKAGPYEEMAINGWADREVATVVNGFLKFLKARCVGAASLGIAKHGKVIAALGFGRKDGRNAEAIFNSGCSSNAIDPYVPEAEEMQYDTPFTYGSVSKAAAFATARWTIKRALKAQDVDVRLISQSAKRLVSANRSTAGTVHLTVWNAASDGTLARAGSLFSIAAKDFSLTRMSDTRFVLALRTVGDTFNLYAYAVDAAGQLSLTDSMVGATSAKQVDVTAVLDQRVVLALRRSDDSLQVRVIKLEANGTFNQLDTENGGVARFVRLVALPGTSRVVGVARLGNPDILKFIVWNVAANGQLTRIHQTELDNAYAEIGKYDLAALSATRVVLATRRWVHETVSMDVFAIGAGAGTVDFLGGTFTPSAAVDFRVQSLDSSHFVLARRNSIGTTVLDQYALNAQGLPAQQGATVSSSASLASELASTPSAGWGSGFVLASRDPGNLLRLTSWDVGANTLVKLKQATGLLATADYAWEDSDVEALMLTRFDFADGLLSKRLHGIVAGYVQPPLHFDAVSGDNSCTAANAAGYPYADAKWKNVSLRGMMSHSAGLAGGTTSTETLFKKHVAELRGLSTPSQWKAQQDLLAAQWGAQHVADARVAMGLGATVDVDAPDGFLVPRIDLEDLLVGSASTCLPNPQGTSVYSNTDSLWLRAIMEHLTGRLYTAPVGDAFAVEGTLLHDFAESELGVVSNGLTGLNARPTAPDAQGNDVYTGANPRMWEPALSRYYASYWDLKRPHCIWSDGTCKFPDPVAGPTLNWNGDKAKVPLLLSTSGESAATGTQSSQLLPHLKYMAKFWSAGYETDPVIGEERRGVWNVGRAHDGVARGAYGYAMQYGPKKNCAGLEGVDVILALNQANDAICTSGSDTCPTDPLRYNQLKPLLDSLLCTVDWNAVTPIPWLND